MNKPRWSDKWRALSDMKLARNAAAGTTSEGTTTGRRGASGVVITKKPTHGDGNPLNPLRGTTGTSSNYQQDWLNQLIFQNELRSIFRSTEYLRKKRLEMVHDSMLIDEPSPSSIKTSTDNPAVFKKGPLQAIQKSPNTLTEEKPPTFGA